MIQKIDHIGIAVNDLTAAVARYTILLGHAPTHVEEVASESVKVAFFADVNIELIAPLEGKGPVADFLAKRGEGVHHLSFQVADIVQAITDYQHQGFRVIGSAPRPGAHGSRVAFLHPKELNGVLVELVQLSFQFHK